MNGASETHTQVWICTSALPAGTCVPLKASYLTSLNFPSSPTQRDRGAFLPDVLSGLKILCVKGPVPQSMKAVLMDVGPCWDANTASLLCTPVSTLPRLRL